MTKRTMDNVARRKEGAKQHAFLVYGVRFGTASEKNEIKIENVEIDLKTTKPDAKGVMAIFGARSRKTANDNKISIINTNFTGDTKRSVLSWAPRSMPTFRPSRSATSRSSRLSKEPIGT